MGRNRRDEGKVTASNPCGRSPTCSSDAWTTGDLLPLRRTDAVDVDINRKLVAIKRRACGYRNPEHFKMAAYFFCGRFDLYPR